MRWRRLAASAPGRRAWRRAANPAPGRRRATDRIARATMLTNRYAAPLVALAVPLLLYGGALVSQYGFGLYPCEMCYWQRWPHQAAALLAALALLLRRSDAAMRTLTLLAALGIAISGLIGIFHAGVAYGFWEGLTTFSTTDRKSVVYGKGVCVRVHPG